jgi:hypothetical protein
LWLMLFSKSRFCPHCQAGMPVQIRGLTESEDIVVVAGHERVRVSSAERLDPAMQR